MHISSVFNDMHSASKSFYDAASYYFKKKKELSKMLNDSMSSANNKNALQSQMDFLRKSQTGKMIREARDKNEYQLEAAYNHYLNVMQKASENLPESVDELQTGLNVNDPTLQNMLAIAKIGKNLPEPAVRDMLMQLRTNKELFGIVRGAMEKAGVEPQYTRGIYPFDGDDMQVEYDMMVEDMRGKANERIYSKLAKIQDRMINDAAAFGVSLDPFVSDEARDEAKSYLASTSMGLRTDFDKAVQNLDNL